MLIAPLAGCSKDNTASALAGQVVDSAGGTVVSLGIRHAPYRAGTAAANGTAAISGHVTIRTSGDTTAPVPGPSAASSNGTDCTDDVDVASSADGVPNALVWIDSMTTGKPLPMERRETFNVDRCGFEPRMLAVVSPTTINVFSRDRGTHVVRFYRQGNGAVDSVRTVDEGEVVPSERIAAVPGIVEARDAGMPGAHGYIAVFSHPYFAVTDASGAFRIDGLLPGTYTVKVWHDRLPAPVEQRIVVGPNGVGRVDVQLDLGDAAIHDHRSEQQRQIQQ